MEFWRFLFMFNMLIPITMFVLGFVMWKRCPKNINVMFGYRTNRSIKNSDTWKFANNYCGRLTCILGSISIIPTVLVQLPFKDESTNTIGIISLIIIAVQLLLLLVPVIVTEKALKKKFNDNADT